MSETCRELMILIVAIGILFMIIGGTIIGVNSGNWVTFVLGVLLGVVIALLLAKHMDATICVAVDMDSESATKYTRKKSAIRFLIMVATLVLALTFPGVFNMIGVLLGILALKFSAYLQPVASKYIFHKN